MEAHISDSSLNVDLRESGTNPIAQRYASGAMHAPVCLADMQLGICLQEPCSGQRQVSNIKSIGGQIWVEHLDCCRLVLTRGALQIWVTLFTVHLSALCVGSLTWDMIIC